MRLTRKHKLLVGLAALFLIINIILIYADNDQKVAQTTHIKTWTKATEQDMYESLHSEGVLDFSEENFVYFDDNKGEFESFLVEVGQEVSAGEELYSYEVDNYYETAEKLENESEQASDEISAIEAAIAKMESYQIETDAPPQSPVAPVANEKDGDQVENEQINRLIEVISGNEDTEQAKLLKEQFITEKEKELGQKTAELDSIETQLTELTAIGGSISVESPYDGIVTNLSESLEDPLLTIQPDELIVRSDLTEAEHSKIETDLPVHITMEDDGEMKEGVIQEVDNLPKDITLHGESDYPFIVSFLDEEEDKQERDEDEDQSNNERKDDDMPSVDGSKDENEEDNLDLSETDDPDAGDDLDLDESDEPNLVAGYHANLEIITDESPNATVVNQRVLHGLTLWKMTTNGTLVKMPVETGLQMGQMIEIEEGIDLDEWIAITPENQFSSNTPFITSLDVMKVNGKRLKSDRWLKDIMIGLLSR